jgi:hypothetical protein
MRPLAASLLLFTAAALTAAQTPTFSHAQLTTAPAANLAAQLQTAENSSGPRWWGYSVMGMPQHSRDCGDTAYLETGNSRIREDGDTPLQSRPLLIMLRLENGTVDKVRSFDATCTLDAGGLPVTWLTGADAAQSARLLQGLAQAGNASATAPLALSAGDAAGQALEGLASGSAPEKVREQAVFWLGAARGPAGFSALQRLERSPDLSPALRRRLVFAFSVSHEPEAVDEMIRMAKTDPSPEVRGQALFWLGQKAGQKAAGAIADAVQNDPDTQVKERAVFGLSQLPHGDGVPLLIHVAESNSNPAVRKRAMFWLGQSKDPRALAFFEKILLGPASRP